MDVPFVHPRQRKHFLGREPPVRRGACVCVFVSGLPFFRDLTGDRVPPPPPPRKIGGRTKSSRRKLLAPTPKHHPGGREEGGKGRAWAGYGGFTPWGGTPNYASPDTMAVGREPASIMPAAADKKRTAAQQPRELTGRSMATSNPDERPGAVHAPPTDSAHASVMDGSTGNVAHRPNGAEIVFLLGFSSRPPRDASTRRPIHP